MRRNRPLYRPRAQRELGPTGSLMLSGAPDPTLPAGSTLWLDASDTSTITKDGNDNVSEWAEKTGGRVWRQPTGAKQPSHGVVTQSGKPVVSLAVQEYLDRVTSADAPAPFTLSAFEGPFTLFYVCSVSGTFGDAWWGNSASLQFIHVFNDTTVIVVPEFAATVTFTTASRGAGFHVDMFERDSGSPGTTNHWLDGMLSSVVGTHATAYSFDQLGKRFLDTDFFDGNIAEVVAFGTLSDVQKNQVLSYLYQKWGVSGSLI